jgi:glyoxylase-like metal-dependent hydrolase (beta-lactamase superfamily II)
MLNNRNFEAPYGILEQVSPLIRRIVANNPSPFTFYGTGTYVIGRGKVAVIDPGPLLESHVNALAASLSGETVSHILITHTHTDHSPAAGPLKAATGAKTYGFGPHGHVGATGEAGADLDFRPDVLLRHQDVLEGPGWHLAAHHTPGHASNHLCYALPEEAALFSGDHVMGWSTSVIVPPDGSMADYMRSLSELMQRDDAIYWPTHGGPIRDPKAHVSELIGHRLHRRGQIFSALSQEAKTPAEIADAVYIGLDPRLRGAAAQSTLAHLLELEGSGAVAMEDGKWHRKQ